MDGHDALKMVIDALGGTDYEGTVEAEFSSPLFGATYTRVELERTAGTIFVREDGEIYDPFSVLSRWKPRSEPHPAQTRSFLRERVWLDTLGYNYIAATYWSGS